MTMTDADAYAREDRIRALWDAYEEAIKPLGLVSDARNNVELLRCQADAYVWGREDAGDRAWFDSFEFGLAFGIHAAEYATGKRHSRTNVRTAYGQYLNHEPIA